MLRKSTVPYDTEQNQTVSERPPGDDSRNVTAPPENASEAGPKKDVSPGIEELFRAALDEQFVRIESLLTGAAKQRQERESCLQIVAECQKQTAAFANGLLERQVLHPAVEAVHELAVLLRELKEQAVALSQPRTRCPVFEPLIDAIDQAAKVAAVKGEYLGAEAIEPSPGEAFDSHRHEIQKAVPTGDSTRHRVIESTIVAGLAYRNKVLRPAKVSVYRYIDNSPNQTKGEHHDNEEK